MRGLRNNAMPDFCDRRYPFHYTTALNVLLKMGINVSTVDIIAEGEYENYRGEVHAQEPDPGTKLTKDTRIVLRVGFPSAVDLLPYQFFFGLSNVKSESRGWDRAARRLMAPFDAAVVRMESHARYQDLRFALGLANTDQLLRHLDLFDFDLFEDSPDYEEALLWASVLPHFHLWAGNPIYVARILRLIFGHRFRILENTPSEHRIPEDLRSRLRSHSAKLGQNMILGRSFREYDSGYTVEIGGVEPADAVNLMPGKPRRRKLEWVLSRTMPSDREFTLVVRVNRRGVRLGGSDGTNRLGYAAYV